MQVTFDLPDEVVNQLQPFADKLPQILELGLRELNAIALILFAIAEMALFMAIARLEKNRAIALQLVLSNTLLRHNQHWARGKVNHASGNAIIRSLFSQA